MEKMIAAKATFKSFKMHYEDAEYFLSMAKKNKKQKNRRVEWRYSRSSILSYYFSIEALINFILYDMHSKKIFSTLTLENLEKMRLPDKYLIVPLLCEKLSGETLDKDDIKHLDNLTMLRNEYVHSKHFKTKPITKIDVVAKIIRTTEGLKEVLPEIITKGEKYDVINIKKNIIDLDYEDALRMKEITDKLFKKMNYLLKGELLGKKELPGISENELLVERISGATPWIESDFFVGLSEEEFKEFDDYLLKGKITKLLEEELSGEDKELFNSFGAKEKEQFIVELVKEIKSRSKYVEDKTLH